MLKKKRRVRLTWLTNLSVKLKVFTSPYRVSGSLTKSHTPSLKMMRKSPSSQRANTLGPLRRSQSANHRLSLSNVYLKTIHIVRAKIRLKTIRASLRFFQRCTIMMASK